VEGKMLGKTKSQIMMANPILKNLKKHFMNKTELKKVVLGNKNLEDII
jgi:hypothetical protein